MCTLQEEVAAQLFRAATKKAHPKALARLAAPKTHQLDPSDSAEWGEASEADTSRWPEVPRTPRRGSDALSAAGSGSRSPRPGARGVQAALSAEGSNASVRSGVSARGGAASARGTGAGKAAATAGFLSERAAAREELEGRVGNRKVVGLFSTYGCAPAAARSPRQQMTASLVDPFSLPPKPRPPPQSSAASTVRSWADRHRPRASTVHAANVDCPQA